MRKHLLWLLALLCIAAAPSRDNAYVSGTTIQANKVTANEDNLFAYLQGGVDTYKAGSVDSNALASSAVTTTKIATGAVTTTSILDGTIGTADIANSAITAPLIGTGAVTSTGILDGTIVNADINASAAIDFSKLASLTSGNLLVGSAGNVATSVAVTGDVTISNAGVTAIGNNKVTGAMIQLGSDAQGDIMYYNGTDYVRLGAGTSGQFLQTKGAAANPVWATSTPKAVMGAAFTVLSGTTYAMYGADNATESAVSVPVPYAGTLKNLTSVTVTRTASVTATFTVMVNGAATAITTTHSGAQSSTPVQDTSNTVTVAAGDLVSIRYVRAGASDAGIKASVELDAT